MWYGVYQLNFYGYQFMRQKFIIPTSFTDSTNTNFTKIEKKKMI